MCIGGLSEVTMQVNEMTKIHITSASKKHTPRVLMVNWVYYPEYGGGALQCRSLVQHLSNEGVIVEVLARTLQKGNSGLEYIDGIPVHRIPGVNGTFARRMTIAAHLVQELNKMRNRIDIVHTHGFMPEVVVAARALNKKVVQKVTLLGLDDGLSVRNRKLGVVEHRIFSSSEVLVAPSQAALYSTLLSGIEPAKMLSIANGVDTELFSPASLQEKLNARKAVGLKPRDFVILFVGAIDHRKGVDLLLDALAKARPQLPNSTRVLLLGPAVSPAGGNGFHGTWEERIRHAGLQGIVTMEGHKYNISEYYKSADLFVLPSRAEGQPNALLEAMASGLPCVVNELKGITDQLIQNKKSGYVVNCEDSALFAARLVQLSRCKNFRKEMGNRARRHITDHHDMRTIAKQYFNIYQQLLDY